MRTPLTSKTPLPIIAFIALLLASILSRTSLGTSLAAFAASRPSTPHEAVRTAWARAQQAGQYQFDTRIQQTVYPALSLGNVGEAPRETYVQMSGQTDVQAQRMQMLLKPEQSTSAPERESVEFKIEGDQSFIRKNGGEWAKSDANVGVFAPGGDALAFLAAAKNIQAAGMQVAPDGRYARYTFDVDGPAFAAYSRDQMQAYLDRKGRLPGGITLGLNEQYERMQASGTLWLDAEGLPARIVMDVSLPQDASGERTQLKFSTDLDSRTPAFTPEPGAPSQAGLDWLPASDEMQVLAVRLGLALLFVAMALALAMRATTQRRGAVRGVQGVLIALLLAQPLALQTRPAQAFIAQQKANAAAQQAQAKAERDEQQQAKRLMQALTGARDWNANRSVEQQAALMPPTLPADAVLQPRTALTSPNTVSSPAAPATATNDTNTDPDNDGLPSDVEEGLGTAKDKADTDGDGLNDGVEALKLGLSATSADTDSDGVNDLSEVLGWRDSAGSPAGKQWYTDPTNADTDGDGALDSLECPSRTGNDAAQWSACPDTDGDGLPDVFDADSDGDGVNDESDTASTRALPGLKPNDVFSSSNPFMFKAKGVTGKQQVYVDFQIRPKDGEHLAWQHSVLDWPANDTEGQIQTYTKTLSIAGATRMTGAQIANDPAATRGNLRMVPMLEINLGSNPPLKRANPKADLSVRNSDASISGTLSFNRTGDATTSMAFSFAQPSGSVAIGLYDNSSCTSINFGGQLHRYTSVSSGAANTIGQATLSLLQGQRVAVISATVGSAVKQACVALPDLPNGNDPQNMADTSWLSSYGVSISDVGNAQKEMVAYVPLNVTYNAKGTRREAWSARMPYWQNGNDWGDTQRANIVWMLQLFGKPDAGPQMIHRYYDEWKLSGLDFTEDYGVNVAVFGSSPGAINDAAKNDNVRVRVTSGLDSDLLRARKSSTTGQRLSLAEIAARFGASGSGSWGLPKADVNVQQYAFATESGLGLLPTQYNRDILTTWYALSTNTLAQLVIARETTQRNLGLESALMQPEKDGVFMINADPNQVPQQITTGYSLTPFEKTSGTWRTQPIQAFADSVSSEYRKLFKADPPTGVNINDTTQLDAAAFLARNVLLSMALNAPSAPVQLGPSAGFDVETPPAKWIAGSGLAIKGIADEVSGQFLGVLDELIGTGSTALRVLQTKTGKTLENLNKNLKNVAKIQDSAKKWDALGRVLKDKETAAFFKEAGKSPFGAIKKVMGNNSARAAAAGVLALATVTASIVSVALGDNAWTTGIATSLTILSSLQALNDALNVRKAYSAFKALKDSSSTVFNSMKSTINATARAAKIGAVIGAIISVGISLALFLFQGFSSGFTADLVAQLLAEVIVAAALLVLALFFPVGTVIAAVLGLIDALIAGICFLIDKLSDSGDAASNGAVGKWICGGITGATIKVLKEIFYRSQTVLDFTDADRLKFGEFDIQLKDQAKGFTKDNILNYQLTLQPSGLPKSQVTGANVGDTSSDISFNANTLAQSKFEYVLRREADKANNLPSPDVSAQNRRLWSKTEMSSLSDAGTAGNLAEDVRLYQRWQKTPLLEYPLGATGINVQDDVNLIERYAIYENDCVVAFCDWDVKKDGTVIPLKLKWDVLPSTLAGFKSHVVKDGGFSFAWGQLGALTFARQKDFDGDGLLNTADGGNDPDDTAADSDGDGLMDAAELQRGTKPKALDSDGDTLRDDLEVNLGIDPTRADSDADGLNDDVEINGWDYVYGFEANGAPMKTWVRSNPLQADGDHDGMLDGLEKIYGRHPELADNGNVLSLSSSLREVQAAVVLLRLDEAADTSSFLNAANANKNAICNGTACPTAGVPGMAGGAARFDGADDVLVIESPVSLARSSFTLAFWAKRTSAGTDDFVISQGSNTTNNGLHLGWRSNNKFICDFYGNALESDATYGADTAFHHWACTYDMATNKRAIYRDGVLLKSAIASGPFLGSGNFTVGNSSWNGPEFFGGDVDEVVVVADALSQTDVQKLLFSRFAFADGVLGRGEPAEINATVNNELNARNASGLLEGNWDTSKFDAPALRQPFNIEPLTGITVTHRLTVSANAAPGLTRVDERAGAQIIDLREQSGFAELWLKLDENPFNASYSGVIFKDSSGNRPARNASCSGASCPQVNNGPYMNSAELTVNDVDLSNSSYTVYFRARRTKSNANQFIVTQGTAGTANKYLHVGWRANNSFTCNSHNNGFDVDGGNEGTEYAWACVYDAFANTRAIYRDGVLLSKQNASGSLLVSGPIKMGSSQFDSSRFQGYLGDVRLYRRALNNEEVASLSGAGGARFGFSYAPQGSETCRNGFECPIYSTRDDGLPTTAGTAWWFTGRSSARIAPAAGAVGGSAFSQAFWVYPSSPIELKGYSGNEGSCSDGNPIYVRYLQRENDNQIYTACINLDEYGLVKDWGDGNIESTGRNNDVYIQYHIQFKLASGSNMNFHLQADDAIDLDKLDGSNWKPLFRADVGGSGKQEDHTSWFNAGEHKLRVRFYEKGGGAAFNFRWDEWAKQAQPQGIIGDAEAYGNRWGSGPLVERVDDRLKVAFRDTAGNWHERTTNRILSRNQWQHVVITYNGGAYKFYINGALRDEVTIPGSPIAKENTRFNLGADNYGGNLYVRNFYSLDDGSNLGTSEVCLHWRGVRFGERYIADTKKERDINQDKTTDSHGELFMYESDNGDSCERYQDGDDHLGRWGFSLADPAMPPKMVYRYDGDGNGALRLGGNGRRTWDVPSTPFKGKLADLRTMRYTLGDAQVTALYDSYAMAVNFKLDEPPGAGLGKTGFKNDVLGAGGICDGAACPTTGVQGRVQQAAFFDGVDDKLTQSGSVGPDLANRSFSVAFWARRASSGSNDIAVAQGNGETRKGLHLGFRNNNVFTCGFGAADLNTSATYSADNEFHHWACTYNASNRARVLYRDGVQVASDTVDAYLGSGPLVVGNAAHFGGPFHGWLDDVRVFYNALDASRVAALVNSAPTANFAFDEPLNTTSFANTASSGAATCSGTTCPKAELQGQLFNALEFDGVDDYLTIPNSLQTKMNGNQYTHMAWVRLEGVNSNNPIFSYEDWGCCGKAYVAGWVADGRPRLYLDNSGYTADTQLLPNIWYHLTYSYDYANRLARIYVNGQMVLERSVTFNDLQLGTPIAARIGNNHGSSYFKGRIDDYTAYARTLTAQEVRNIFSYQQGLVSDRASQTISIDTDAPTSIPNSIGKDSYRRSGAVQVSTIASDTQSAVQLVDLALGQYTGASLPPPAWAAAQPCAGSTDGAAWCAYIAPTSEGKYQLQSRAVDVASNVQTTPTGVDFFVDASAPSLSLNQADGATVRGITSDGHRSYAIALSGTASDPNLAGGYAGSGLHKVSASLQRADGADVSGSVVQTATLSGSAWTLSYTINGDATGAYTLTLSAEDNVGNVTALPARKLFVDASSPRTQSLWDVTQVISTTSTASGAISGTASDPDPVNTGVKQVQVNLEPVNHVPANPYANVSDNALAMYLPLNESVASEGQQIVPNAASTSASDGSCVLGQCPSYSSGKVGNAANFGGSRKIEMPHDPAQAFDGNLSISAWAKPNWSNGGQVLLEKWRGGNGYALAVAGRYLVFYVGNGSTSRAYVADGILPGVWQHVAVVAQANAVPRLYLNGAPRPLLDTIYIQFSESDYWLGLAQVRQIQTMLNGFADISANDAATTSNVPQPMSLGAGATRSFSGQLDEVRVYFRALGAAEVTMLSSAPAATAPVWQAATLAAPNAQTTTWQFSGLPAGAEGTYRINLRGEDNAGNLGENTTPTQLIVIDRQPPQITAITRTVDSTLGATRVRVVVQDRTPDNKSLQIDVPACQFSVQPLVQSNADSWTLGALGKTNLPNTGIVASCVVSQLLVSPVTVTACDLAGQCTTRNTDVQVPGSIAGSIQPVGALREVYLGASNGLSIGVEGPLAQSWLTNTLPIALSGTLTASQSLRELGIYVNDARVYTQTWAQGAATSFSFNESYTPTALGAYEFEVRAESWPTTTTLAVNEGWESFGVGTGFGDVSAPSAVWTKIVDRRAGAANELWLVDNGVGTHSGSNAVFFNSATNDVGDSARLQSPQFSLVGLPSPKLRFWLRHANLGKLDGLLPTVRLNGGVWRDLGEIIYPNNSDDCTSTYCWREHIVDLNDYATYANVEIGFLAFSNAGEHIVIDDISVGAGEIVRVNTGVLMNTASPTLTVQSWNGLGVRGTISQTSNSQVVYVDVSGSDGSRDDNQRATVSGDRWALAWQPARTPTASALYTFTVRVLENEDVLATAARAFGYDQVVPSIALPAVNVNAQGVVPMLGTMRDADVYLTTTLSLSETGTLRTAWYGWLLRERAPDLLVGSDGEIDIPLFTGVKRMDNPSSQSFTDNTFAHMPIEFGVDGGQRYFYVAGEDANGNFNQQMFGPYVHDTVNRPDYIDLVDVSKPYLDWTRTGCTELGYDERSGKRQTLYLTRDQFSNMAVAWRGLNPATDGDLFVYLENGANGTGLAYNPFEATMTNTLVLLPSDGVHAMKANYAIHVQGTTTATLLRYDDPSAAWVPIQRFGRYGDSDAAVNGWFEVVDEGSDKVMVAMLPLRLVNNTFPTHVLGLATEKDGLRVWASVPTENPITSRRLARLAPTLADPSRVQLGSQVYVQGCDRGGGGLRTTLEIAQGVSLAKGDPNAYFVQPPIGMAGFAGYSATTAYTSWLSSSYCPANAEHPECVTDKQTSAKVQRQLLAELGDVDQPPLQPGQVFTASFRFDFPGYLFTGNNTYFWFKLNSDAPVSWPNGCAFIGAQAGSSTAGTFNVLPYSPALEFTVPFTVGAQTVEQVWVTMYWNNNNVVPSMGADCGASSPPVGISFGDSVVMFTPDREAPSALKVNSPLVVKNLTATVRGTVIDLSPIRAVTLEVTAPLGSITQQVCADAAPTDGLWECEVDLVARNGGVAPTDGQTYGFLVRAMDPFGQTSAWSPGFLATVDTTAAEISLTTESEVVVLAAAPTGILSVDEAAATTAVNVTTPQLQGVIEDNRLLSRVEVCDASGLCELAELTQEVNLLPPDQRAYDDAPATPIGFGDGTDAANVCGTNTTGLVRSFIITETFNVGEIKIGVNITHPYRGDVVVQLRSPQNVLTTLFNGDGRNAEHVDAMFVNDLKQAENFINVSDDPSVPRYDVLRASQQSLSPYIGASAAGTWQLLVCDASAAGDSGLFNSATLYLADSAVVSETRGTWNYFIPNALDLDNVTRAYTVTAYDEMGNASAPLVMQAKIDAVAPAMTVTQLVTVSLVHTESVRAFSGNVSDGDAVSNVAALVVLPDGASVALPVMVEGTGAWVFDLPREMGGMYEIAFQATDTTGNARTSDPYSVTVLAQTPVQLFFTGQEQTPLGDVVSFTAKLANPAVWPVSGMVTLTLPSGISPVTLLTGTGVNLSGNVIAWQVTALTATESIEIGFSGIVVSETVYAGTVQTVTGESSLRAFAPESGAPFALQALPSNEGYAKIANISKPEDVISPTLNVTQLVSQMLQSGTPRLAFSGTVTDDVSATDVLSVVAVITAPNGITQVVPIVLGTAGEFVLAVPIDQAGEYSITFEARDAVGNVNVAGPFVYTVTPSLVTIVQVVSAITPMSDSVGVLVGNVAATNAPLSLTAVVTAPDGSVIEVPIEINAYGTFVVRLPANLVGVYEVEIRMQLGGDPPEVVGVYRYAVLDLRPYYLPILYR